MSRSVQAILGVFIVVVAVGVVAAIAAGSGGRQREQGGDGPTAGLHIDSLQGNTVVLRDADGILVSAQVDAATVIKRGDQVITLADLRAGDRVEVRPNPDATGQTHLERITVNPEGDGSGDD